MKEFIFSCVRDFLHTLVRASEIALGIWLAIALYWLVTRFVK